MNIHESYYSGKFRDIVSFDGESESAKQVEFIEKSVPLFAGYKILDLACGYGRHSLLLAKKGYRVTATDLSADYLAEAQEQAKTQGLQVDFIKEDMRYLAALEEFDVILSLSTSLAFYDDDTNANIFRRVRAALKPSGTFVFDQANIFSFAAWIAAGHNNCSETLPDGRQHHYSYHFDAENCVVSKRSIIEGPSQRAESGWDLRYYTSPEVNLLAKGTGLEIVQMFGGYDGSEYSVRSRRLITIMRKHQGR